MNRINIILKKRKSTLLKHISINLDLRLFNDFKNPLINYETFVNLITDTAFS